MAKPAQKSRRGRRLALLFLLVLVAAWLGRGWWLEPWIAQRLARSLSTSLGSTVTVETLSGSWWSDLSVEGLVADDAQASPLRRLVVSKLRADYDPAIVLGDLTHCRSIRADGVELVIDARKKANATDTPTTS
jgi:autotransporter translocation and assembly factor TamB